MNYLASLRKVGIVVFATLFALMSTSLPKTNCQISNGQKKLEQSNPPDLTIGGFVYTTAFSPDGKLLAAGGSSRTVKLWDSKSWRLLFKLKQPEYITAMKFAPSQKILATVNNELGRGGLNNVRIIFWSTTTGEKRGVFKEDDCPAPITSIAYSPNGKVMAVGLGNGLLKSLNVEQPVNITVINEKMLALDSGISSLRFSADGRYLSVGAGKGITGPRDYGTFKILEVQTGREVFSDSSLSIVFDLAFSPDSKFFAVAGNKVTKHGANLTLLLFDTEKWKRTQEIKDFPVGNGLEFSEDGRLLMSVGSNESGSKIALWDTRKGKRLQPIKINRSISSFAISPNNHDVALGGEDGQIQIKQIPVP
jgi:WD40 repeat protein